MNVMPITELIDKVTEICKANGVKRLDLFALQISVKQMV